MIIGKKSFDKQADWICDVIFIGDLIPGGRLMELGLAAQIGLSRSNGACSCNSISYAFASTGTKLRTGLPKPDGSLKFACTVCGFAHRRAFYGTGSFLNRTALLAVDAWAS
ncbi:hypothetical protein BGC_01230 [Burkholderia sp. 3C]